MTTAEASASDHRGRAGCQGRRASSSAALPPAPRPITATRAGVDGIPRGRVRQPRRPPRECRRAANAAPESPVQAAPGIDVQSWGGASFDWTDAEGKPVAGTTAWLINPQESKHFAPSAASFMVNYRVEDLHALVKALKEEGCNVLEKIDESDFGKFAWVIDPEGNKVELWQPPEGQ